MAKKKFTFIDLFAGLGGFHLALNNLGCKCVFASELKEDLRKLYIENFPEMEGSTKTGLNKIEGDITKIDLDKIPPHDILCGGFPCQPFSQAGKQQGFDDEAGRGELFNYIVKIIRIHRPRYIFLENVSNLENHDNGRTWKIIQEKLSNTEEEGGLNYDICKKIISPHEYGFPQHRKRIYIVGVDRSIGSIADFKFPDPDNKVCNINDIIETNPPTDATPIKDTHRKYIQVWQTFLDLCCEHKAKLPHAPIWAMEFGATYDYKEKAPAFQSVEELTKFKGKLGKKVKGYSVEECIKCLPNYAQTNKSEVFPPWKIKFITENRKFYEENKKWINEWKKSISGWENSFMKFEWNCDESNHMTIEDKILQFRPSGLRVKRPTYSPALTFTSSQVPIFPWAEYNDNGKIKKGRYMTMKEAARIQGMGNLSFNNLSKARIYEALGNAVDVDIVELIAKNIIDCLKK